MPTNGQRRRHAFDRLPKKKRTVSTKTMARPKVTSSWSSCGPAVEVADDEPLHHDADQHPEQRAGDHRDDEGAGERSTRPAGVAAEHEHRAMGEIQHAERAVDDRQAGGDQRQQRAEHQPVEELREEIGPIDHGRSAFPGAAPSLTATARLRTAPVTLSSTSKSSPAGSSPAGKAGRLPPAADVRAPSRQV